MTLQRKAPNQRALVVGISHYRPPIPKLPGVARDVSAIATLLGGRNGVFPKRSISLLTETKATRKEMLDALDAAFRGASKDETVFVYLAGHGAVAGNEYFFLAYDSDFADMPATAVPLKAIKAMFDAAKSRQVCLWLDFCHSGGIVARRVATTDDDLGVVKRTLQVVQGQGKVIYAACSPAQSAYEDPKIGHGLFTHALLRGLQGKAIPNGEVTVSSLFDFIDREVGTHRQRPEFFGHLQGRMVLMHYELSTKSIRPTKRPTRAKASKSGTWVLLDRHFLVADFVRDNGEGTVTLQITPEDEEQNAIISSLRSLRQPIAFAYHTDAARVSVRDARCEAVGAARTWTLTLRSDSQDFGYLGGESALEENGRHYSADDIATLRKATSF